MTGIWAVDMALGILLVVVLVAVLVRWPWPEER